MIYSQIIPKQGPIKIEVIGFGWNPKGHLPILNVRINDTKATRFTKKLGKWLDSEGKLLNEEEQKYMQIVWEGECKKNGIPPFQQY